MYPAQTVVALESRAVELTWQEADNPANVAVAYEVYIKQGGVFTLLSTPLTKTEFITPELPVGRTHVFKIRTRDEYGNISDSDELSIFLP